MNDRRELFTIGQLAQHAGVSVRTVRFWSDAGLVPPTDRSGGGYRLYDAAAVARLDLVRTLRELGLDLDTVGQVLSRQRTVAEVARAHADALDIQIRVLKVRRAVLRSVSRRDSTTEEMRMTHDLARLSAQQRQRLIDEFVDRTFAGLDLPERGDHLAAAMRQLPAELPEDPTPEQVDAWLELATLVGDADFQRRVRQMAVAGAAGGPAEPPAYDGGLVTAYAGAAAEAGVDPRSPAAREVLDRIVDPGLPAAERVRLAEQVETFSDRRVERYWQLLGVLAGRPPFAAAVPAFEWFAAALRAHCAPGVSW